MRGAKARAYLDRLKLVDFSKPQQRKARPLPARPYKQSEIDQIAQHIANFAIKISIDEAIEFLVKLTVQWVQTMNADSILESAIANKKAISSYVTDNELSNILLERIFLRISRS